MKTAKDIGIALVICIIMSLIAVAIVFAFHMVKEHLGMSWVYFILAVLFLVAVEKCKKGLTK